MPKELKHEQPTSSLAHLLSSETLDSATAVVSDDGAKPKPGKVASIIKPAEFPKPVETPSGEPTGEPTNIPRQFHLTKAADTTLKQLVRIYSDAVGFELSNAEVLRGLLHGVSHAVPTLKREARHIGHQRRFKNSRGNEALRDELERKVGKAFVSGMRAAPEME
jgi:hypothetical protein